MIVQLQSVSGVLGTSPTGAVLFRVPAGYNCIKQYLTISNTGSSTRLIRVFTLGRALFYGETTNSPLKAGQTLEIDTNHLIQSGQSIDAWADGGSDSEYVLTVGLIPA